MKTDLVIILCVTFGGSIAAVLAGLAWQLGHDAEREVRDAVNSDTWHPLGKHHLVPMAGRIVAYIVVLLAACIIVVLLTSPAHASVAWGEFQHSNDLDYSINGHRPAIAKIFFGWYEQPDGQRATWLETASAAGTTPFIAVGSCGTAADGTPITLAGIAAGKFAAYETAFGHNIAADNVPVIITFDHEMNGGWYCAGTPSAYGKQPAAYVAAWDQYTTAVNAACACPGLITWSWDPNVIGTGIDSPAAYLPDQNVDMAGIDGYFQSPSSTFASVFSKSIADVKAVTRVPVWIAETGVMRYGNPDRFKQIRELFAGGCEFLYFNAKGASGPDWSLGPVERRVFLRQAERS